MTALPAQYRVVLTDTHEDTVMVVPQPPRNLPAGCCDCRTPRMRVDGRWVHVNGRPCPRQVAGG